MLNQSPTGMKFAHKKKTRKNPESLSHLGFNRYRVVTDTQTDRRTDRIAIANTRLALRAVARKNGIHLIAAPVAFNTY